MTQAEMQQVEAILGQFEQNQADLIPILQQVQATFYYLQIGRAHV